ncbi:MAG: alpha/beta hydrolase [Proteobacteria bacterium]|nr:alpha/beta hydrolase [Pseudomonadota bacterium]
MSKPLQIVAAATLGLALLTGAVRAQAQAAPATAPAAPAVQPAAPDTLPLIHGRFTVQVVGHGPDVILIPGLSSSRDTFAALVKADAGRHRLHLVQLAGFAGTPAGDNAGGDKVAAPTVEAIAEYIREAKLKRPAVIGHSLGGESALMLAAHHPDLVSRVMVVDAFPFYALIFGKDQTPETAARQLAPWRDGMLKSDDASWRKASAAQTLALVTAPEHQREVQSWMLASDRAVTAHAFFELGTTDLRPELPKIAAPTTVLYAYNSFIPLPAAVMDANVAEMYAGLKSVKLIRVDDSRHFISFDKPERFVAEAERFLDGR